MKLKKQKKTFKSAFQKVPFFSKISTKLIILIIFLSVIPLLSVGYFTFNSYRNSLEKQILDDLILVAESQEGHLLTFIESIKGRAVDFASDGFIRDSVQEAIDNPKNLTNIVNALDRHLIVNKQSLDRDIYGINVINLNGEVIASTDNIEIGSNEKEDDYFINTLNLNYGNAFVTDAHFSHHFASEERSITSSAPITNRITGEKIGIIVNYYRTSELDNLLTGRQAIELGAISGLRGRRETLEIYLVNKDGLMISESRFLGKDVFLKQIVNTKPVGACITEEEEIAGVWPDYRGIRVFGASMCMPNFGWTLLVEIDEEEIFLPINKLRNTIRIIVFLIALIITILGIYFSRMLINPLEEVIKVTEKISEGNLTVRVDVQSKDEIGILAHSFNRMTNNLINARQLPENILRSIKDSLFVIDTDGNITEVNEVALKVLNYEKEELIGKPISFVFGKYKETQKIIPEEKS